MAVGSAGQVRTRALSYAHVPGSECCRPHSFGRVAGNSRLSRLTVFRLRRPAMIPSSLSTADPAISHPQCGTRSLEECDYAKICSWVTTRNRLELVCSDLGDHLTPEILATWNHAALSTIVILDQETQEAAGFCTLTSRESAHMPSSYIELCHLVVDPHKAYLSIGSKLCCAAKQQARAYGYRYVLGRVVPRNRFGIALARRQGGLEVTGMANWLEPGFRWFRLPEVRADGTI